MTSEQIEVRASTYGCCTLDYLSEYVDAKIHGDPCAEKKWALTEFMWWSQGIMCQTETTNQPDECYTPAYATQVARRADCYCTSCGCADNCVVTPNYTVEATVPVSDRATVEAIPPQEGDQWFVISGTTDGVWTTNEVVTWNGSGWDTLNLPSGQIVSADGVLWTTDGVTPGLLYPTVTAEYQGPAEYTVVSDYPSVAAISTRTVIIQVLGPIQNGPALSYVWTTVLTIAESEIATPYLFNFTGLSMDAIRATYVDGDCQNTSDDGSIEPPGCVFPGDHDCDDHQITSHF